MPDDLDLSEDKRLGAAILTTSNKNISTKQLELAGEILSHYLEAKIPVTLNKSKQAGPFIFEIGHNEDLLSFIRELQSEFHIHDECDYMKLELRFR